MPIIVKQLNKVTSSHYLLTNYNKIIEMEKRSDRSPMDGHYSHSVLELIHSIGTYPGIVYSMAVFVGVL